jgi:ferric-dicitrate binding protein FerR (iron transport regulator)
VFTNRHRDREIRELSLRAADGTLTDMERARFNQLIETDDEACRLLLEYSMLDADLVFHARSEAAEDRAAGGAIAGMIGKREAESGKRKAGLKSSARRGAALAAAACVALVAAWAIWPSREAPPAGTDQVVAERQPQPIASLSLAPGAEFDGRQYAAGDAFLEGDELSLSAGEVHVSMSSGADFVLQAPGALKFVSAKHVQLKRGVLTAHVAEWGSGFTVDTDRLRVIDLGTRFAVAATTDDDETHVLQGQVRVQPLATTVDGRRSVLLSEGEALRIDRGKTGATRIDAEQDRFSEPAEGFRPFKPIAMYNTGASLAEGDEDPHWRITAGPEGGAYHVPQFGVVSVPHERYAPNEPDRSQWISVAKDLVPGCPPNSLFTFETEFDLAGFDLATVMVAAQVLADNGVRAIRINGEPASMEPWDDNVFGQSFTRNRFRLVEIQRGFLPGVNKLEIDVWNGVYQLDDKKNETNPMSLRVEFQAYGRLVERGAVAMNGEAGISRVPRVPGLPQLARGHAE